METTLEYTDTRFSVILEASIILDEFEANHQDSDITVSFDSTEDVQLFRERLEHMKNTVGERTHDADDEEVIAACEHISSRLQDAF